MSARWEPKQPVAERLAELGCLSPNFVPWIRAWLEALPEDIPRPWIYGWRIEADDGEPAFSDTAVCLEWNFNEPGKLGWCASLECGPGGARYFFVTDIRSDDVNDIHDATVDLTPEVTARVVDVLRGAMALP